MTTQNETYLGDGLYAEYDGFALWLRAPREQGDHVVALEPQVLREFIRFAMQFRAATIADVVAAWPENAGETTQ